MRTRSPAPWFRSTISCAMRVCARRRSSASKTFARNTKKRPPSGAVSAISWCLSWGPAALSSPAMGALISSSVGTSQDPLHGFHEGSTRRARHRAPLQSAEHHLDEVVLEPGQPAVHRVRGRVGVGRVDLLRLGLLGDAEARSEREPGVVHDAEPRFDLLRPELDLDPAALGHGAVEGRVDELERGGPLAQQLRVYELLPLLLGALLGGVEVRGREQTLVDGVVLGGGPGELLLQLAGDPAEQLHLVRVERGDDAFTPALEPWAHDGCSMVAQRPWPWRRATSASAFSRVPSDTAALPSWCTWSINRVAFSRE